MKTRVDVRILLDKTVREIERTDYHVRVKREFDYCSEDVAAASVWMWRQISSYRYTDKGELLTIGNLLKIAGRVREEFIQQHRINYMTFLTIQEFYDWIDGKGNVSYNVRKYWRMCERAFSDYQAKHKETLDHSTWMTVQDHMSLAYAAIVLKRDELFPVTRDYMIQKRGKLVESGQKDDIELLHRISVCLMFIAATRNTFNSFFRDIICKHGVDLSSEFSYASLEKLRLNFVRMCEQMGVRFTTDKDGYYVLLGIDITKSVRIEGTWNALVKVVTDSEVMDKTAERAIERNPETYEDYKARLEREESRLLESSLSALEGKYKVVRA